MGPEAAEVHVYFLIDAMVKVNAHGAAHKLAAHRGNGGTGGLHAGKTEQAEDHNGVQNNIGQSAGQLGDHGVKAAPGSHQQLFQHTLQKAGDAQNTHDAQIVDAVLANGRVGGLGMKEGAGAEQAEQQKRHKGAAAQKQAVLGRAVHLLVVLFAQAFAEQGIYAHSGAHGKADQQVLHGKSKAECRKGILGNAAHKHAVYNVVQSLHQHRDHHRYRQFDQQRVDGHIAHGVFFMDWGGFGFVHKYSVSSLRQGVQPCRSSIKNVSRLTF